MLEATSVSHDPLTPLVFLERSLRVFPDKTDYPLVSGASRLVDGGLVHKALWMIRSWVLR